MSAWLFWIRGPRRAEPSLIFGAGRSAQLNEFERGRKLAEPIALKEGDEALPLDVLARLYPAPAPADRE